MDPTEIRSTVITAMFADDKLMNYFALKGGCALELIHGIVTRGTLDVDLSIPGDFDDFEDVRNRVFRAITDRFDALGYVAFDLTFEPAGRSDILSGYQIFFKIIEVEKYRELDGRLTDIRRQSTVIDTKQHRKLEVQISKREYCEGKELADLKGFQLYVYSLPMCAIEKLRAICQQMPEYRHYASPSPRARDFLDIHEIITKGGVDLAAPAQLELFRPIFDAKEVPLQLLRLIDDPGVKEFHRPDWDAVVSGSVERVEEFDFYFDYVVRELRRLQSLWME